ncbi:PrsW family intramembrane metalloprotease [Nocardioides yefusunii]|uniref:PrsW family intramembrane metalloprotease n=1 Tax=Nocardioides yefusunii TaxID=2500546 RepID=A0ABW1QXI7_9ACTN|nr:PrsW family intramembrane metalloprotease [Nocardioides yefusunii]
MSQTTAARPHVARRTESIAFVRVVSVACVVGAVLVAGVLLASGEPAVVALGVVLAALPVGPLVGCYLWLDRYEPEPRSLLLAGFCWGAFASTTLAVLLQLPLGEISDEVATVVAAPLTEESTKGFFLLMLFWWRRSEFDGVLDGIVYAGMVGIGFAFVENALYLVSAVVEAEEFGLGPGEALGGTFVVRCLVSPFAHPLFTMFTGVAVGLAIGSRSAVARFCLPVVGWTLAVVLHGLWNGAATWADGSGFLFVYVVLMAPVFVLAIGLALWVRGNERRVLTAALLDAARRGLLPETDIPWLVDLRARRLARSFARTYGEEAGLRAMEEYQQAAVEFGFLHHRYLRGTPPPDFAARGASFVARLSAVRPLISFPGQVVPTR